jgi:GT2 family glycosyltransferase
MTGKEYPSVAVVILNTNRRSDTLECLQSLSNSTYPNLSVMVLDNASEDGSVEAIQALFPEVRVVSLTENKGYAGNNNVGIELAIQSGAEWIYVLNEDTLQAQMHSFIGAGRRIGSANRYCRPDGLPS